MEKVIKASIPEHIFRWLRHEREGEILCVGSSGVYLQFGQRIVLLSDESWGILPIGIGVENFQDVLRYLHLRQGQTVQVQENRLVFPTGGIMLLPVKADLAESGDRLPMLSRVRQAARELAALRKERGISMLVLPLVLEGRPQQQDLYCVQAGIYLEKLMHALREDDREHIRACLGKLLGLGMGLTPSADDVLLGMLYVFRELPRSSPASAGFFQEQVLEMCDGYTGKISAAYLKAIIDGAPFERMEQVFRGICGERPLDIEMLTQIGSSSGTEMLLGMLIALRICGYQPSVKEKLP